MQSHPTDPMTEVLSGEILRSRARDAEIKALTAVTKALAKLDEAGRARVLAFVVAQEARS